VTAFDVVVIGSGPAGQKAAIQAAKAGRKVLIIEEEADVGGACVHRGTIPSKTLRETAALLGSFRDRTAHVFSVTLRDDLTLASLMARKDEVIRAHQLYLGDQLARNGVERWHGRASFVSPHEIRVRPVRGEARSARGEIIVVATGSHPRVPTDVPIDHEHILDSDSILSMTYLPASLAVLGGGVIASEYASIFASLGVKVTMIDAGKRPVAFLDPELTSRFLSSFAARGGRFIAEQRASHVEWDGVSEVVTTLQSGETVRTEKLLFALGRVANFDGLCLEAAGLRPNARGVLAVDEHCRTEVCHIYAAGDVIGPPSLASSSMEQGRRAMCHALDLPQGQPPETIPLAVYTIPEMSSVGWSEAEAVTRTGGAIVGRVRFDEVARGQIAAIKDGLLKLVADAAGERILGVQIVGEGAAELVHLGQMALLSRAKIDVFIDNIYNFPTMAEAYRIAALDILRQRPKAG
jgi:NAD(P) transhydrogenase